MFKYLLTSTYLHVVLVLCWLWASVCYRSLNISNYLWEYKSIRVCRSERLTFWIKKFQVWSKPKKQTQPNHISRFGFRKLWVGFAIYFFLLKSKLTVWFGLNHKTNHEHPYKYDWQKNLNQSDQVQTKILIFYNFDQDSCRIRLNPCMWCF